MDAWATFERIGTGATVCLRLEEPDVPGGTAEFELSRDAVEDCKEMAGKEVSDTPLLEDEDGWPLTVVRFSDSLYRIKNVAADSFPESLALMDFHARRRVHGLSPQDLARADEEYLLARKIPFTILLGIHHTLDFLGHPAVDTVGKVINETPGRPRLLSDLSLEEIQARGGLQY
ncbi:uncharacterized protein LOC112342195 [Selaginella moellendorffii]|uniref:uncharacterized protein LOC112342195 n=1 Tax=Selaginella moellendorffii TaxID=88036 RepID=UPI000D1C3628|nr:uncharacterized protein LOC112342195 [Selaginella moellendorffii]|eukprot:XP_024519398.1 uncharacterized protein LOC112342195 [Selaginella moellendorffii]